MLYACLTETSSSALPHYIHRYSLKEKRKERGREKVTDYGSKP